jgi:hypothetical protein
VPRIRTPEELEEEHEQTAGSPAAPAPPAHAGAPMSASQVLAMQRGAGNAAVGAYLNRSVLAREDEEEKTGGTAVATPPAKVADGAAVPESTGDKATGPPKEAEPIKEKPKEPEHPAPPKPKFDLAGGQQILTAAFGKIKTIVPGTLQLLEPDKFKEAYDKIYGAGQWSWDKYVVPTYGSLNGFAYNNVNYINKGSAGLHTVVHEMLHNNCHKDFIPFVGSRWNEGTTEILTQVACKPFNEPAPVCYPGESPAVQAALDSGLPLADLTSAYLEGDPATKIGAWVDKNCVKTWAQVKALMEAKDWAAAKAGLAKKA